MNSNSTIGYRPTQIGLLPEDWEVLPFGKVFDFLGTNSYSRENLTDSSTVNDIFNIHYGDIHAKFQSEHLDVQKAVNIPVLKDSSQQAKNVVFLKDGDLIIADASEDYKGLGACVELINVKSKHVVGGLHTIVARDSNAKTVVGFRTYILRNAQVVRTLKRIATGISVYSISKGNLAKLLIAIPTLQEQRTIANILSIWDETIQKVQQLIGQLKQRNKGLSQSLLKTKTNWKEYKLSDIFERVTRKNNEVNTNVVTISAQRGFVRQDHFFNKQIASDVLDNYFLVEKGEFCYNKSYSKGYDWGATKRLNDFDKAVVTTLYICFRLKDDKKHSGNFFEYFFESGLLDVGLSKIAHEGGRAHGLLNVTPHDFFNLKISVPDMTGQNRIYNILFAANNELNLYEKQLANLLKQKKGLMQELLTGKTRIK